MSVAHPLEALGGDGSGPRPGSERSEQLSDAPHSASGEPRENGFIVVEGTPTDCVHLALTGLLDRDPGPRGVGHQRGREPRGRRAVLGHRGGGARGPPSRSAGDRGLAGGTGSALLRDRGRGRGTAGRGARARLHSAGDGAQRERAGPASGSDRRRAGDEARAPAPLPACRPRPGTRPGERIYWFERRFGARQRAGYGLPRGGRGLRCPSLRFMPTSPGTARWIRSRRGSEDWVSTPTSDASARLRPGGAGRRRLRVGAALGRPHVRARGARAEVGEAASGKQPAVHVVRPRETLSVIAWRYGARLALHRALEPHPVSLCHLSGAAALAPRPPASPAPAARAKAAPKPTGSRGASPPAAPVPARGWAWPATGRLLRGFGKGDRGGDRHRRAARSTGRGRKERAGGLYRHRLVGYGRLVIIKHDDRLLTATLTTIRLLVKEGQTVRAGQKIAEMGSTGADRVMLHFEVRRDGKPSNPLKYLPRRG